MIQAVVLFYNSYIKPCLCPTEAEQPVDSKNYHKKKIERAGQEIQNTALPLDKRAEAVGHIGLLAYTGGYCGATLAATFMPTIVDLLKSPELTDDQRINILEGLTGICYVHLSNQRQAHALGLYTVLQEQIVPASLLSTKAKLWSCYLLNILCFNNIPIIRVLMKSDSLRQSLEVLEAEDWTNWPKNYALELLCMLGFWPPQAINTPGDKTRAQLKQLKQQSLK